MSTDNKDTNVPEVKEEQPLPASEPEKVEEAGEEQTIGEALQSEPEQEAQKPQLSEAQLDKLINEGKAFEFTKKENKTLKRKIKEMEEQLQKGASMEDVADDIESLAEEFQVDTRFLSKLEKAMRSKFEAEIDERVESKLKPLTDKEKETKQTQLFDKFLASALEKMPEYEAVINKEQLKILALAPSNKGKTMSKLIEETYSGSLGGRPTIETTTPRGGKEPKEVDFARARKDPEYFREIMSDKDLKEKYNDGLAQRIIQ